MALKPTLLLIDPHTDNDLYALLQVEYKVLQCLNEEQALTCLNTKQDEISGIVINDYPFRQMMELFQYLDKQAIHQRAPILLLGGNAEEEAEALKQGVWDFVLKPYHAQSLLLRINNALRRSHLTIYRQLKYLEEYDSLTGIYNKNKFYTVTKAMIDQVPEQLFAFIRFDIDRFQLINSFFGTEEGDRLLCYIANVLHNFGRKLRCCTYGRIESDIFCLCLSCADLTQTHFFEMIRNALYEYNNEYDIVPSLGIYLVQDRSLSIEAMYNRATLAAKQCKGSYVNCFAYYSEFMSVSIAREQEIINEMNNALEKHQFVVYLQPKIDLTNGKSCGAEALTRWNHPRRQIDPHEFIEIFERNGFITKLDYYIWEQVCAMLRRWIDDGYHPYPISVNISRVDLYNPKLVDMILDLVHKYEIVPELLNLELTESAYNDNPVMLTETIERLQRHGFTIMMDDFGSGYSSLNILKDMDVDVLKIDMRFLSKTKIAGRGENIIASVIRMSKWLNIPVIAEGVETAEQVEFLRSVGCDYVQGFYYEKPIPAEAYERKYLPQDQYITHCTQSYRRNKHLYDELFINKPQIKELFHTEHEAAVIFEFANEQVEVLRVNANYYRLLGVEDQALKIADMIELVVDEDQRSLIELFKKAVDTHTTQEIDYTYQTVDGLSIDLHLALRFIAEVSKKAILIGIITQNSTNEYQY